MSATPIAFMSQDERDAILGRTMREHNKNEGDLALIDAELENFADKLGALMGFVNAHIRRSMQHPSEKLPRFPDEVSKYIDAAKLTALLEEQDRILAKVRSGRLTLDKLGQ